jgi:hypothetical protein
MRKITIVLAIAMSLTTMGMLSQVSRADAAPTAVVGEDDTNDTTPEGSASPSGGVATGAGGTAPSGSNNTAPWLAAGVAGTALTAFSLAQRRRHAVRTDAA